MIWIPPPLLKTYCLEIYNSEWEGICHRRGILPSHNCSSIKNRFEISCFITILFLLKAPENVQLLTEILLKKKHIMNIIKHMHFLQPRKAFCHIKKMRIIIRHNNKKDELGGCSWFYSCNPILSNGAGVRIKNISRQACGIY